MLDELEGILEMRMLMCGLFFLYIYTKGCWIGEFSVVGVVAFRRGGMDDLRLELGCWGEDVFCAREPCGWSRDALLEWDCACAVEISYA